MFQPLMPARVAPKDASIGGPPSPVSIAAPVPAIPPSEPIAISRWMRCGASGSSPMVPS
jgi:hypothetical protein